MLQSIGTTMGTIYLVTGNPGVALRVTLIAAPIFIGGIAIGLVWGINGVAIGYAIASLSLFYYTAIKAFHFIDLKLPEFHKTLLRPSISTLAMVILLIIMTPQLKLMAPLYQLLIGSISGLAAYVCISIILNRAQMISLIKIISNLK